MSTTDPDNVNTNPADAEEAAKNAAVSELLKQAEAYHVQLEQEKANLQKQLDRTNELWHGATTELQQLQSERQQQTIETQRLEQKVVALEHARDLAQTRQTTDQERCDRLQVENDQLREELSRLSKSNTNHLEQITSLKVQSQLDESQTVPLLHEKQRLQTELDSLQAHAHWLEQELHAKQTDYQHLQQESRDRSIQLQLQLDVVTNNLEAANARLHVQQKMERELQDKLTLTSRDNLQLKQDLESLKEEHAQELGEEQRLVKLQQQHLEQWQTRYHDAVRKHETLQQTAQQALTAGNAELQAAKQELETKYTALLQEQAAAYEEKLTLVPASALTTQPPRLRIAAAARIADAAPNEEPPSENEPLNMTQLYEKWEETKSQLRQETASRKRWQLQLQRIQMELQHKAPALLRQRQEYDLAVQQLQDYQKRLRDCLRERDDAVQDAREAHIAVMRLQAQVQGQEKESHDLARQVQALLAQRARGVTGNNVNDNSSDEQIPTSIQEMQSQNQRLLAEHRRLTQTVAELEEQLESDTLRTKLDKAEQEVAAMQKQRHDQEILVEKIVQQRDLYRALLYKHDSHAEGSSDSEELTAIEIAQKQSERAKKYEQRNTELEAEVKRVQAELDQTIRDRERFEERVERFEAVHAELTDTLNQRERDLLSARSDVARAQSDATYHKEKCERLESSLERARNENAELERIRHELQKINSDLERSVSVAQTDRSLIEGEMKQLQAQLRRSEAVSETARAAEQRQTQENAQLRAELARHGALMETIRRMETALSARMDTEKEGLARELESAQEKLQKAESNHLTVSQSLMARIQELEARVEDSQNGSQKHQNEALKAQQDLLQAQTEVQKLKAAYQTLESKWRTAQRKLGDLNDDGEDEELSRQAQLQTLEAELEAARAEIAALRERADNYQKLAQASEKEVAELQQSTMLFRSENAEQMQELRQQLEEAKAENIRRQNAVRDLTNDLMQQQNEHADMQKELEAQVLALKTEMHNNEKDVDSAKAAAAAMKLDLENLRLEVMAAQNNYERELAQHSEARTALRTAREAADVEAQLRHAAVQELENCRDEHENHRKMWEQEKKQLQEDFQLSEKSMQVARDQNKILHEQLETLNRMMERSQSERVATAAGDSDTTDGEKVLSEQREILRFLRSENEMLQAQLDTAKRTAERERAAAIVARRSLEEARAELQTLQNKPEPTEDLQARLQANSEQLELLRDSNKLLREESEKLAAQLSLLQKDLTTTQQLALPAENMQRQLNTQITALEAEKASLQRELESWKSRMTSLVSNFNQIDPEEHQNLQKQVEQMRKEEESHNAWKKTTEAENTRIRGIAQKLKATVISQKEAIERLTVEKASLTSASTESSAILGERDELRIKIGKMEKDSANVKTELEGANSRNDKLRDRLRDFQGVIRELREREKNLTQQLAEAQQAAAAMQRVAGDRQNQQDADKQTPSEKLEVARVEPANEDSQDAALLTNSVSVPSVPTEGFKFGPSEEETKVLRVDAAAFVPGAARATTPPQTVEAPLLTTAVLSPTVAALGSTSEMVSPALEAEAPGKTDRRPSSDAKELSYKQKLLIKKKKLADALKKKAELDKRKREEEELAASDGQANKMANIETPALPDEGPGPAKKAKTEENSVADSVQLHVSPDADNVTPPAEEENVSQKGESTENENASEIRLSTPVDNTPAEMSPLVVDGVEPMDDNQDEEDDKAEEMQAEEEEKPSFEGGSPHPFAAEASKSVSMFGSSAATFGQPSTLFGASPLTAVPAVGSISSAIAPAFGSAAFLNIKPPGSSAAPPTFTFGSSSNITLPTPVLPPAPGPSPFGAFGPAGSTTSFGTAFGAAPTSHAQPLFGAPLAPAPQETEEHAMDDDEGDMDAHD